MGLWSDDAGTREMRGFEKEGVSKRKGLAAVTSANPSRRPDLVSVRYSASQTVSSCWFRKWLGMMVQPRTLDECGMIRCHWNPMMKCTSSS